ncbi:hypothetical protein [Nitrosovibrio sp. Nv4]|uniref:hypothetical protein n=1 Tax=Nitrosovibrio sp. Nv4 TaxID=1945880 RepID=UPI000BE46F9E|nr:hypothetical protein [Nitrosovibrio sp. Nv4]
MRSHGTTGQAARGTIARGVHRPAKRMANVFSLVEISSRQAARNCMSASAAGFHRCGTVITLRHVHGSSD